MTRAQDRDSEIDYRSAGSPGAERTIVVLRTGALATTDPDARATAEANVRLVLVHLDGPELDDPAAFGGETPAGSTASALAAIAERESEGAVFGLIGERATAAIALALAAQLGAGVDRLALVAAPLPPSALERDVALPVLARVQAGVLLLAAASDPDTVPAAAWYAEHLPRATSAEVPAAEIDSPDGRLGLADAWRLALAHVAR